MEPSECIENRGLKQIDPIPTISAFQPKWGIERGDALDEIGPLEQFGYAERTAVVRGPRINDRL